MLKRKPFKCAGDAHDNWAVMNWYTLPNGRVLKPGDEFTVKGEAGASFRFVRHVTNETTGKEWIDCIGGQAQHLPKQMVTMFRAFRPERITCLRRVRKAATARAKRAGA